MVVVAYIAVGLNMGMRLTTWYVMHKYEFLRGMFPIEGGGAYMASTRDIRVCLYEKHGERVKTYGDHLEA